MKISISTKEMYTVRKHIYFVWQFYVVLYMKWQASLYKVTNHAMCIAFLAFLKEIDRINLPQIDVRSLAFIDNTSL